MPAPSRARALNGGKCCDSGHFHGVLIATGIGNMLGRLKGRRRIALGCFITRTVPA